MQRLLPELYLKCASYIDMEQLIKHLKDDKVFIAYTKTVIYEDVYNIFYIRTFEEEDFTHVCNNVILTKKEYVKLKMLYFNDKNERFFINNNSQ